jgi:hypothetical protein
MDQNYIIDTLKNNINRSSALDTLMDVERVLDNLNIYAYKNWIEGEIVEGPHIDRYWVTVTIMYPYKLMPDPEGALRLTKNDCKVYYAKDELITAAKLIEPEDSDSPDGADGRRPGQARAKKLKRPVWLVTLEIPRKFMDGFADAQLGVEDQSIDTDAVEAAYDDGLGDDDAIQADARAS